MAKKDKGTAHSETSNAALPAADVQFADDQTSAEQPEVPAEIFT